MKLNIVQILVFFLSLSINSLLAQNQNPSIKIGAVYSLTGGGSIRAEIGQKAVSLAVKEINNAGGINGRPVEVLFEDSKTIPGDAVSAYNKLRNIDKVDIIIGDVFSFTTNALIPLTLRDKQILISPSVMDKSVEASSPFFYTLAPRAESLRKAYNDFFDINKDVKTVFILCRDDAWGHLHLDLWKEIIKARGLTIIGEICQNDFGHNYYLEATKIKAKKPDAVIITYLLDNVLRRLKEQNISTKILTTIHLEESIKIRNLAAEYTEGTFLALWPATAKFEEAYKKMYGEPPFLDAHNHYDIIYSIAAAYQKNPTNLLAGLQQVKFEGASGLIDFTNSSNPNSPNQTQAILMRVNKNHFVAVNNN